MADCCSCGNHGEHTHIPLADVIKECDRLFNQEKTEELGEYLRFWRRRAAEAGDKKSELSLLSELMGHYRMNGDLERGLPAVREGFALIDELGIGDTAGAGTIYLNGATALQAFGLDGDARKFYQTAERCYRKNLPADDPRFAGLFNNMATSYLDSGDFSGAENCYLKALEILERTGNLMDSAVTCVNLAQLFDARDPEDPKIEEYLDRAMAFFDSPEAVRDGYYAHTCRKCASAFGYFGRFMDEQELNARADRFYAGS